MSLQHLLGTTLAVAILGGSSSSEPRQVPVKPSLDVLIGTESLAWVQPAFNLRELRSLSYLAYVDGVRIPLAAASCDAIATSSGFSCDSPLPPLSPGRHIIELAAVASYGDVPLESGRSSLVIVMAGNAQLPSLTSASSRPQAVQTRLPLASRTSDGVAFSVEKYATHLDGPVAMTFTADGLLVVIERHRQVRILGSPHPATVPALTLSDALERGERGALVDVTASPDFVQTRHVYVLSIAQRPGAEPGYQLSRFRELNGTLGERAVLLDGIPVSPHGQPGAIVRFGPDGRLYIGFQDLDDRPVAQDLGALNGKILRLTEDGSVPRDNPRASPVFSYGHGVPVGLAWHPTSGALWETERALRGRDQLNLVMANRDYGWPDARLASPDALNSRVELSDSLDPIGAAFYTGRFIPPFRGDLFFVSRAQRALYRVRFDAADLRRVVSIEPLLENRLGRLGGVVSGPDGAVYVFTTNRGASGDDSSEGDCVLRLAPAS